MKLTRNRKRILGMGFLCLVIIILLIVGACDRTPVQSDSKKEEATLPVVETAAPAAGHIIDAPFISQTNDYPTGCESVSAVMALRYAGYTDVTVEEFIDEHLAMSSGPQEYWDSSDEYDEWEYDVYSDEYSDEFDEYNVVSDDVQSTLYAESPWEYYLGSPYDDTGWGCYSPVIADALKEIVDADAHTVETLSKVPIATLCSDYIDNDIPVIFWATSEMKPAQASVSWVTPAGETFTWLSPEHCLLLVGYDDDYYYFNDPQKNKKTPYPRADVEMAYGAMYGQAIVIRPNTSAEPTEITE